MEMKRALAATPGTVLGFTMMAAGPAFADDGHHAEHHKNADRTEETRCGGKRTSEQDREWLKSAIEGDHFENAVALASALGIKPPTAMSDKQREELSQSTRS
jgi:hypothetical protein